MTTEQTFFSIFCVIGLIVIGGFNFKPYNKEMELKRRYFMDVNKNYPGMFKGIAKKEEIQELKSIRRQAWKRQGLVLLVIVLVTVFYQFLR